MPAAAQHPSIFPSQFEVVRGTMEREELAPTEQEGGAAATTAIDRGDGESSSSSSSGARRRRRRKQQDDDDDTDDDSAGDDGHADDGVEDKRACSSPAAASGEGAAGSGCVQKHRPPVEEEARRDGNRNRGNTRPQQSDSISGSMLALKAMETTRILLVDHKKKERAASANSGGGGSVPAPALVASSNDNSNSCPEKRHHDKNGQQRTCMAAAAAKATAKAAADQVAADASSKKRGGGAVSTAQHEEERVRNCQQHGAAEKKSAHHHYGGVAVRRTATTAAGLTPSMRNRPGAVAVEGIGSDGCADDHGGSTSPGRGDDDRRSPPAITPDGGSSGRGRLPDLEGGASAGTVPADHTDSVNVGVGWESMLSSEHHSSGGNNDGPLIVATVVDEDERKEELRREILASAVEARRVEVAARDSVVTAARSLLGSNSNLTAAVGRFGGSNKARVLVYCCGCLLVVVIIAVATTLGVERANREQNAHQASSGNGAIPPPPPTQAPTAPIDNNSCETARPVVAPEHSSSAVVVGSLKGSAAHGSAPACPPDGPWKSDNYGRWYSYVGKGIPVTLKLRNATNGDATTSSSNVHVVVYSGSCPALNCVGRIDTSSSADDGNSTTATPGSSSSSSSSGEFWTSDLQDSISWRGRLGVVYHILISSKFEDDEYEFAITESDTCEYAYPIDGEKLAAGALFPGNTKESRSGAGSGCDASGTSAGIFFSVVGTGRPVQASTCKDPELDTVISVLAGDCTNCVAYDDDSCNFQSMVTFPTIEGEMYLILVHGKGNQTGQFTLEVKELAENALCESAIGPIVPDPDAVVVALPDGRESDLQVLANCSPEDPFSISGPFTGGFWYSVRGTGNEWKVSDAPSFDPPEIYIFQGDCDALQCVSMSVDSSDGSVTWMTELEVIYRVLFVSDWENHELKFEEVGLPSTL